ncbi:hypothetical protein B0H65DRAFT_470752, partial [Neurospora tetraspora]
MAPPAAPKMEEIPQADSFSKYLAEGAQDLPRSSDLFESRHAWSYRVRDELEDELERECRDANKHRSDRSKKSHPSAGVEDEHQEPKIVYGQRRKREDDSEEEEAAAERFTKRRNVNVDPEKRPSQPLSTSYQSHALPQANPQAATQAPTQTTARPVHPHKFALTDNGPWYQAIYNEVYKKVYSEIYDEAYSKAYNLAYNDAFKDGYEHGNADGCHDGNNRGFEDGYRHGYKESYRICYGEGQENARDMMSSDDDEED